LAHHLLNCTTPINGVYILFAYNILTKYLFSQELCAWHHKPLRLKIYNSNQLINSMLIFVELQFLAIYHLTILKITTRHPFALLSCNCEWTEWRKKHNTV